jgi:2'-5' RNA ligase
VFSLNVPVPPSVERLAADLRPSLTRFDTVRDRHTLVAKRFDADADPELASLPRLRERLRETLRDAPAFETRTDGLGVFERPVRGPGPVVYLRVESPGLHALHERLCDAFGAVPGLEGEAYVPHVTLARGGSRLDVDSLLDRPVDDVQWSVSELHVWDSRYRERVASIPLPA